MVKWIIKKTYPELSNSDILLVTHKRKDFNRRFYKEVRFLVFAMCFAFSVAIALHILDPAYNMFKDDFVYVIVIGGGLVIWLHYAIISLRDYNKNSVEYLKAMYRRETDDNDD